MGHWAASSAEGEEVLPSSPESDTNVPTSKEKRKRKPVFPIKSIVGLSVVEKEMEEDEEFRAAVVRMMIEQAKEIVTLFSISDKKDQEDTGEGCNF